MAENSWFALHKSVKIIIKKNNLQKKSILKRPILFCLVILSLIQLADFLVFRRCSHSFDYHWKMIFLISLFECYLIKINLKVLKKKKKAHSCVSTMDLWVYICVSDTIQAFSSICSRTFFWLLYLLSSIHIVFLFNFILYNLYFYSLQFYKMMLQGKVQEHKYRVEKLSSRKIFNLLTPPNSTVTMNIYLIFVNHSFYCSFLFVMVTVLRSEKISWFS